jgi:hypothetical protein
MRVVSRKRLGAMWSSESENQALAPNPRLVRRRVARAIIAGGARSLDGCRTINNPPKTA